VLKSETAINISIKIMDAFVASQTSYSISIGNGACE
jgi:hypothetical protein